MLSLFIILSLTLIFCVSSIIYWTLKNGISPMPTAWKVKAKLLTITLDLPAGIIYELGAGWGTLAFSLAQKYPNHSIYAYETSWIPYYYCVIRQLIFPQKNLFFFRKDFFTQKLNNPALIVSYLYPAAMNQLKLKFDKELPKDTLILTHTFGIRNSNPLLTYDVLDLYNTKIYVYRWNKNI